MKVAPGDVVHVKGTVTRCIIDGLAGVNFGTYTGYFSEVWIAENDIVHVERAPLKVGDSVRWKNDSGKGTIIAIDATEAWVRHGVRGGSIVFISDLQRA